MTVLGVAARGFSGVQLEFVPQVFVPMMMKAQMTPLWDALKDRRTRFVNAFGRLKPGVTHVQAKASLQPFFKSILDMEVKEAAFSNASVEAREAFLKNVLDVRPGRPGTLLLPRPAPDPSAPPDRPDGRRSPDRLRQRREPPHRPRRRPQQGDRPPPGDRSDARPHREAAARRERRPRGRGGPVWRHPGLRHRSAGLQPDASRRGVAQAHAGSRPPHAAVHGRRGGVDGPRLRARAGHPWRAAGSGAHAQGPGRLDRGGPPPGPLPEGPRRGAGRAFAGPAGGRRPLRAEPPEPPRPGPGLSGRAASRVRHRPVPQRLRRREKQGLLQAAHRRPAGPPRCERHGTRQGRDPPGQRVGQLGDRRGACRRTPGRRQPLHERDQSGLLRGARRAGRGREGFHAPGHGADQPHEARGRARAPRRHREREVRPPLLRRREPPRPPRGFRQRPGHADGHGDRRGGQGHQVHDPPGRDPHPDVRSLPGPRLRRRT